MSTAGRGCGHNDNLRTMALELGEATSRAEDGVSTLIVVMTGSEEQRTVARAVRPELGCDRPWRAAWCRLESEQEKGRGKGEGESGWRE